MCYEPLGYQSPQCDQAVSWHLGQPSIHTYARPREAPLYQRLETCPPEEFSVLPLLENRVQRIVLMDNRVIYHSQREFEYSGEPYPVA